MIGSTFYDPTILVIICDRSIFNFHEYTDINQFKMWESGKSKRKKITLVYLEDFLNIKNPHHYDTYYVVFGNVPQLEKYEIPIVDGQKIKNNIYKNLKLSPNDWNTLLTKIKHKIPNKLLLKVADDLKVNKKLEKKVKKEIKENEELLEKEEIQKVRAEILEIDKEIKKLEKEEKPEKIKRKKEKKKNLKDSLEKDSLKTPNNIFKNSEFNLIKPNTTSEQSSEQSSEQVQEQVQEQVKEQVKEQVQEHTSSKKIFFPKIKKLLYEVEDSKLKDLYQGFCRLELGIIGIRDLNKDLNSFDINEELYKEIKEIIKTKPGKDIFKAYYDICRFNTDIRKACNYAETSIDDVQFIIDNLGILDYRNLNRRVSKRLVSKREEEK